MTDSNYISKYCPALPQSAALNNGDCANVISRRNANNDHMRRRTRSAINWREAGRRLRVTRLVLGLSEAESCRCIRRLQTYRKYEAGARQTSMSPSLNFAQKFDVSLDWLVQGEAGGIRSHLAKHSSGKPAILPAVGPTFRETAPCDCLTLPLMFTRNLQRFPAGTSL